MIIQGKWDDVWMANSNFYTIVTKIGQAKIANAISFGTRVIFSTMKIGDSNGQYYEPTEDQTSLVHEVYEVGINQITVCLLYTSRCV